MNRRNFFQISMASLAGAQTAQRYRVALSMGVDGEAGRRKAMQRRIKIQVGGLGTHTFDLMRHFAGDPQWVFAYVTDGTREVTTGMGRDGSEPIGKIAGDNVAAMFGFPSGVHGYFGSEANELLDGRRFGITLYGSKAIVFVRLSEATSEPPYLLRQPRWVDGKWERIEYPPDAPALKREQVNAAMAADLLDAIERDRQPICSSRDGRWALEMGAGVYQSQLAHARLSSPLTKRTASI